MEDELLREFLGESREHLATIEADLLAIEEAGANLDEERVNKVFRAAHSIKGGSSFLGLMLVKELAHKAETVLDMLRTRKMTPNAEVVNVLLAAFDKLREMINNPVEREKANISDLIEGLGSLANSYLPKEQKGLLTRNITLQAKGEDRSVTLPEVDFERARRSGQCVYCINYDLIHDIEKKGVNVLRLFRELAESGEILDCSLDFEAAGSLEGPVGNALPLRLILATTLGVDLMPELLLVPADRVQLLFDPARNHRPPTAPAAIPAPAPTAELPVQREGLDAAPDRTPKSAPEFSPVAAPPTEEPAAPAFSGALGASPAPPPSAEIPAPAEAPTAAAGAAATADATLRVRVDLLETLMNLAGELVLARNQLHSAIAQKDEKALAVADQRINQVTSELQDAIMRTRLQPIGNVFGKLPRIVRDLGAQLHKEIQLEIVGKDVALDRSLVEGLSDPLTHMVRNAADHGIEPAADRLRSGKKAGGHIRIEARHEAGQVVVEIADDGKGIDSAKVAAAALAKGLITPEKLRGMSERDKLALILLPGLSTAQKVTDVSGRGVGMDVVRTNLERLGGQLEITSEMGKGSTFRIKLPLTLAIIPSLIISVGRDRFAIPQINVSELLRVRPEEIAKRLDIVGDAQVLLLRDQVLPLVRLDLLLGSRDASAAPETEALEIAVVTTGSQQYALVVSSFHGTEEIVVKPLGRHLKGLSEYAGATILGDGAVALILDVAGVSTKAKLGTTSGRESAAAELGEGRRQEDLHSLLLFHNAPDEVCAVSLGTVLRIERATAKQIEMAGNRRTIQYRGASLPLVTLSDAASVKPLSEVADLAVIVFGINGREVGLLGAMPVDVVESSAAVDQVTHRQKGISGSAIIRNQTTLLLDVFELVETVYPDWARPIPVVAATAAGVVPGKQRLLLAEDSDFFRSQIRKYLEQGGFEVIEAADGEAAWEQLQEHAEEINAVVTDIEMPRLTGLGLTARIRGTERFAQLPVIALSSLAGEDDVAKGLAAGVTQYQVKLDRDRLLAGLHECIGTP